VCIIVVRRFDILANGGGSVTLHFQRQPFQSRRVTVFVPWNRIMVMDVVTMTLDVSAASAANDHNDTACSLGNIQHDYYSLRPSVVSLWRDSHLPSCSIASTSLIPETQVSLRVASLTETWCLAGCCFVQYYSNSWSKSHLSHTTLCLERMGHAHVPHKIVQKSST